MLPNFFLIGAPKCGTTALHDALQQHPQIYMGKIKEPGYFAFNGIQPPIQPGPAGSYLRKNVVWQAQDYLLLYANGANHRAVGDATPLYLRSQEAAHRIKIAVPMSKIVAILRQPAERAYSSYLYMTEKEVEQAPTFSEALAQEPFKIEQEYFSGLFHKQNGFYYPQLAVYYDLFPREQIKVFLYEDWNLSPQKMLQELFEFLEVDLDFQPVIRRSNVTRLPRNRRLHHLAVHPEFFEQKAALLSKIRVRHSLSHFIKQIDDKWNLRVPPRFDAKIRAQLTEEYRDDILKLQELIQRDLSHWLH